MRRPGILILTSNRVGIFDEAFKSRIQLSLRYKNLDQDQRLQIWSNFIGRLDRQQESIEAQDLPAQRRESLIGHGVDVADLKDKLQQLSRADLNGREIRNTLSVARQLALHRKEPLRYSHLDIVMGELRNFDQYVTNVHRGFSGDHLESIKGSR